MDDQLKRHPSALHRNPGMCQREPAAFGRPPHIGVPGSSHRSVRVLSCDSIAGKRLNRYILGAGEHVCTRVCDSKLSPE
jgi:hypothetical protein